MRYRQVKIAGDGVLATRVSLKIEGCWVNGILLNEEGAVLALPHEVEKGRSYIIEVDNSDCIA